MLVPFQMLYRVLVVGCGSGLSRGSDAFRLRAAVDGAESLFGGIFRVRADFERFGLGECFFVGIHISL